jgi:2Fe-2S ferredoxin
MIKIHVTEDGAETVVTGQPGHSLMETLRNANVEGIVAECGGSLACASCHVYVDDDWLTRVGEVSDMEDDMLDCTAEERGPNSRLSCQIELNESLDGLRVQIPEDQI